MPITSEAETLPNLMKAERKAFQTMMNGSQEDACALWGEEGKNYLAWCAAADAERAFRERASQ